MLSQDYFELKISIWTPLPNLILHTHTEGIQAKFREKQGPLLNNWECNKNVAGHQAIFFFFVEQTKKTILHKFINHCQSWYVQPFPQGGGGSKIRNLSGQYKYTHTGITAVSFKLRGGKRANYIKHISTFFFFLKSRCPRRERSLTQASWIGKG